MQPAMHHSDTNRCPDSKPGSGNALRTTILGACSTLRLRYARWREHAASIRHLEQYEDYLLRDIGIAREDIECVVRGIADTPEGATKARVLRGRFSAKRSPLEYEEAA